MQQLCLEDESEKLCDNYCESEAAAQLSMSGVIPSCFFVKQCEQPYYCKCKDRVENDTIIPQFVDIDGECVDATVNEQFSVGKNVGLKFLFKKTNCFSHVLVNQTKPQQNYQQL